jgi:uncharacterized membrane protein
LTGAQLTHELGRLGPKFFSFGLSFWVIGRFWISHHLTFQYLTRWDLPMLWLNLFWLACIVFLPFPTAVLGNHIALPEAARLYAATVTVTGLASTLLWWYATGRGRLVDEDLDPRLRRSMLLWALAVPVVFGLSIPLVTVLVPIGGGRISLAPLLWLLRSCGCCWSRRSGCSSAWCSESEDAGPLAADRPVIHDLPPSGRVWIRRLPTAGDEPAEAGVGRRIARILW